MAPVGWAAKIRQSTIDVGDEDLEVEPRPAGFGEGTLDQPGPRAGQVLDDARRIATDVVDVRRRDLDQPLEERPLGGIVGAHPGGLEELMGVEEVAHGRRPRGRP